MFNWTLVVKHYTLSTEVTYVDWIKRYIKFHKLKHSKDLGKKEVSEFLTHLAVRGHVSPSTQNKDLHGSVWLVVSLLYGASLRLKEALRLQIKDIEFSKGQLTIRHTKRKSDRITMLPMALHEPLKEHLKKVKNCMNEVFKKDLGPYFFHMHLNGNTKTRISCGHDSSPFLRHASPCQ